MHIPGESAAYRAARSDLLAAEAALRAETERVAALRRALPEGPPPKADYMFEDAATGESLSLADLFGPDHRTLFFYNLMYAPAKGQGLCSMCASMLDGLNGAAPHIDDRIALAIGARASAAELKEIAAARGWSNLRIVSTAGTAYAADYGAETPDGGQLPIAHVWTKDARGLRAFWGSELFSHRSDWASHPRHLDTLQPLWNVFDLTPDGRGEDWMPRLEYA